MNVAAQAVEAFEQFGSKAEAARQLGIPVSTLKSRLDQAYRTGHSNTSTGHYKPRKHLVIPDTQVRPGVDISYLEWVGKYIEDQRPDVIVMLGDFADMPSLSTHDKPGSKAFEGKRYKEDVKAVHEGMRLLCEPFVNIEGYKPRMVLTLGNHEDRITRAIDANPILDGTIGIDDLEYEKWGWEVVPYRKPIKIDGIAYCHYFYNQNTGKPLGGTAHVKLKNIGMSFTMGHQQGKDAAERELSDGSMQRALIVGSCYLHDEDYKGPQSNHHWRGVIVKHEVHEGSYDLMEVSLNYLRNRYA